MKKFMNKKCTDMTVGETMKFTVILTVALSAVTYGMMIIVFKIDDIMSAFGEFRDKISDSMAGYKGKRVMDEEDGLY